MCIWDILRVFKEPLTTFYFTHIFIKNKFLKQRPVCPTLTVETLICSRLNKLFLKNGLLVVLSVYASKLKVLLLLCLVRPSVTHKQADPEPKQRASTYHSPFHPSCPRSRCHGHRPNGRECSADYRSDTRSPCMRVVLGENMETQIKQGGIQEMHKYDFWEKMMKTTSEALMYVANFST